MEQDLFKWLNSKDNNSQGTGLLLAPLSDAPEPIPEVSDIPDVPEEIDCKPDSQSFVDNQTEQDPEPEPLDCKLEIPETVDNPSEPESDCKPDSQEFVDNQDNQNNENNEDDDLEEIPDDHEWQERATGFTLSLDEPPPELWTGINDDDEELDYEENDSLQGAAYVQIHGRNFTERLHYTLRHRKEKAEERAEAERESAASSHPYFQKSIIFCSTLLMCLAFAWASLWFLDGLVKNSKRAQKDVEPTQTQTQILVSKEPEVQPKPVEIKTVPIIEKPPTFEDYLNEANHAYNIGMYNRSIIYFFRAHEVKPADIRPYIGLANAYRMKGFYFDSRRILDEARSRFRRNPDIEMGYIFLREEK